MSSLQPSLFDRPATPAQAPASGDPSAAVAALLATLAPLYTPAALATECSNSTFRARLAARIVTASGCSRFAALAALRSASILP